MRFTPTGLAIAVVAIVAVASRGYSQAPPVAGDRLVMVITGLRNDSGIVRVGLYDTPSRWPQSGRNSRACDSAIRGRRATCEIANVRAGVYAIALTHDENSNGHFDQGFLGWPLEGYGFSNNVRPRMLGAPSWDSARFAYAGGAPLTIAMTMQY